MKEKSTACKRQPMQKKLGGVTMKRQGGFSKMTRLMTVALLVLVMAIITVLSGCSTKKEEVVPIKEEATASVETTTEPEPTTEVGSMDTNLDVIWFGWNVSGYLPVDDSVIEKELQDRFNLNIENVMVDVYNSEAVNVLMASGFEFDIGTMAHSFSDFHELGLIRPVPEEYIATYLSAQYDELINSLGDKWKLYATIDDELYGVPVISAAWECPMHMGIRTDWLEAVGYSEDNLPATLDELEEMLLKLHTDDPDGNGQDDTYALDMFDDYYAYTLGAYGMSAKYWYNDDDGNPAYYAIDENYKEALKVLQRWYDLGIYDPEVVTDGRSETTAKFVAGTVGGYYGTEWAFSYEHASSPLKSAKDSDITIEMTIIPPVAGPSGKAATTQFSTSVATTGMIFGRNCSDEKLIRLLQVQNAISTDNELMRFCLFGTEGETYIDVDGYVETTDAYNNESRSTYGMLRYLNANFKPESSLINSLPRYRIEGLEAVKDFPRVEPNVISVFATDAESEYGASTKSIAQEFFWKALTGEIDIDAEWDAYVDKWMKAGGQEILDAKQALFDSVQ